MTNIQIIEQTDPRSGEVTQHVIIDKGNGEFTSMPKAVWDELEAKREDGQTL